MTTIRVADIAGIYCTTEVNGFHVSERLRASLRAGESVVLDFLGVECIVAHFIDEMLSPALREFGRTEMMRRVQFRRAEPHIADSLEMAGRAICARYREAA